MPAWTPWSNHLPTNASLPVIGRISPTWIDAVELPAVVEEPPAAGAAAVVADDDDFVLDPHAATRVDPAAIKATTVLERRPRFRADLSSACFSEERCTLIMMLVLPFLLLLWLVLWYLVLQLVAVTVADPMCTIWMCRSKEDGTQVYAL